MLTFALVAGSRIGLDAYADEAVSDVTRRTVPRVAARAVNRMNALVFGGITRGRITVRPVTSLFTSGA
jgi:hypothetical protein